jgi:hypothetical protein
MAEVSGDHASDDFISELEAVAVLVDQTFSGGGF